MCYDLTTILHSWFRLTTSFLSICRGNHLSVSQRIIPMVLFFYTLICIPIEIHNVVCGLCLVYDYYVYYFVICFLYLKPYSLNANIYYIFSLTCGSGYQSFPNFRKPKNSPGLVKYQLLGPTPDNFRGLRWSLRINLNKLPVMICLLITAFWVAPFSHMNRSQIKSSPY